LTLILRFLLLFLWLNHYAHSPVGMGLSACSIVVTRYLEKLVDCVVGNIVSMYLILSLFQSCLLEKLQFVSLAIIFHTLAPALDVFIHTVPLLPETGEITESSRVLETAGIFFHRHLVSANN